MTDDSMKDLVTWPTISPCGKEPGAEAGTRLFRLGAQVRRDLLGRREVVLEAERSLAVALAHVVDAVGLGANCKATRSDQIPARVLRHRGVMFRW